MIPQNFIKAIASEHRISSAELEVLSLAMEGESVATMAANLHISEDAVRKRLSEVYQKFQIEGRGPVKLTKLQQRLIRKYQEQAELSTLLAQANHLNLQSSSQPTQTHNYLDWDSAPDVSVFYDRSQELAILNDWIVNQRCRLISLIGIGGIGKTALGVKIAQQIQEQFDYLIWRSLYQAPSLDQLLTDIIQILHPQGEKHQINSLNYKISWLITHFKTHRCLIILDGLENLLLPKELVGTYTQGYENYGQFFRRFGEENSKSCILITSREQVREISFLEGETSPVRSLKIAGLGENAKLLLKEKKLSGQGNWQSLIEIYGGNPLLLKLAATTIQEVFDGNVSDFLDATLFPRNVTNFVRGMLNRLSDLELKILIEIANQSQPILLKDLITSLVNISGGDIISAVVSLRQRSLVEKSANGFIVSPVVREVALS
ncbi:regulatory protein LuxR [Stanieria cyanosphaera PCC 7437]|uniref:Regulatory protein LuxR n=1 Tax=Stanieria cyanosphaera (strain ATCC 29371 / PCC 7437) TaxID=111780 RepID=K9XS15_STAC7|nr:NB-ARC domain-containing protein [Stanieria cyanosphaera]AFZ34462.1 regulatory protein LuxR [Stanieria cyanosphaera PCC 7437]